MDAALILRMLSKFGPVDSVSIGKTSDTATWAISINAGATAAQRTAILAAVAGFNPAAYTLRKERDAKLTASDLRSIILAAKAAAKLVNGQPIGAALKAAMAAWEDYRQALRDITDNTPDPDHPSWPVKPDDSVIP